MTLYNKWNIIKGARYTFLAEIVNKKKHTIQIFFSRNDLDINNPLDVKKYISNNLKITLK